MHNQPEIRKVALGVASKLCTALSESIEREKNLKDGSYQDYRKSPGHICGDLVRVCELL